LIITHHKSLEYVVAQLMDEVFMCGSSFAGRQQAGYPMVKAASRSIGHGLTVTYTEHLSDNLVGQKEKLVGNRLEYFPPHPQVTGLVWINETSCHHSCAIFERECQALTPPKDFMEKIEKKHLQMLDRIPSV
jgi:hypothetical protein